MATSTNGLTTQQLAAELEVTEFTLLRWRKELKGPPFYKIGQRYMYPRDGVDAYKRSTYVDTLGSAEEA